MALDVTFWIRTAPSSGPVLKLQTCSSVVHVPFVETAVNIIVYSVSGFKFPSLIKFVIIGILSSTACVGGLIVAMYLYAFGTASQSILIEDDLFSFAAATIGNGALI